MDNNVANRRGFIGGSDIQHVLGIAPYGCLRRLHYQKTGAPRDREFVVTGPIEIGVALEDYVADKAAAQTGWRLVRRAGKADGHRGVHIDREIQKARDTPGVAEIKVIGDQAYWAWMRDGVPMGYILQLQWGMKIWDRAWGAIIAWNRDAGGDVQVYQFYRDDSLLDVVSAAVDAAWAGIEAGEVPQPLRERDGRCDACEWGVSCRESEWGALGQDLVQIDAEPVRRWMEVRRVRMDAEVAEVALLDEVKRAVGDHEQVMAGGVRVTWRPQESWRVDVDALKREKPEIAAAYMRKSVSRPLRVSERKAK